jgi:hypothetical protein
MEKDHKLERDTLRRVQKLEDAGVKQARERKNPGRVLSFVMRITGVGKIVEGRRKRADSRRAHEHRAQREKLDRRHERETLDFRHREHALSSVEARERRSLETQIRRERFRRTVDRDREESRLQAPARVREEEGRRHQPPVDDARDKNDERARALLDEYQHRAERRQRERETRGRGTKGKGRDDDRGPPRTQLTMPFNRKARPAPPLSRGFNAAAERSTARLSNSPLSNIFNHSTGVRSEAHRQVQRARAWLAGALTRLFNRTAPPVPARQRNSARPAADGSLRAVFTASATRPSPSTLRTRGVRAAFRRASTPPTPERETKTARPGPKDPSAPSM